MITQAAQVGSLPFNPNVPKSLPEPVANAIAHAFAADESLDLWCAKHTETAIRVAERTAKAHPHADQGMLNFYVRRALTAEMRAA
jgi:hypothetical protein